MKEKIVEWFKAEKKYRAEVRKQKSEYSAYKKHEKGILNLFNQFAGAEVPTAEVRCGSIEAAGQTYAFEGVELLDAFKDPTIQAIDKLAKENNLTLRFIEHGKRYDMGGHDPNGLNIHLEGMPDKTVRIKKFSLSYFT